MSCCPRLDVALSRTLQKLLQESTQRKYVSGKTSLTPLLLQYTIQVTEMTTFPCSSKLYPA